MPNSHGVYDPTATRFRNEDGNPRVVLPESVEQANFTAKHESTKRVLAFWYQFQYIATLEQGESFGEDRWRLTFDHPKGPHHQVVVLYDALPIDTEPYPVTWNLQMREICEGQPYSVDDVIAARRDGNDYAIPVRIVEVDPRKLRGWLKVVRISQAQSDSIDGTEPPRKKRKGTEMENQHFHVKKSECFKIWVDSPTHFDRHDRALYPSINEDPDEGTFLFAKAESGARLPVPEPPPSTPQRQRGEQKAPSDATPTPHQLITPSKTPGGKAQDANTPQSGPGPAIQTSTALSSDSIVHAPPPSESPSQSPRSAPPQPSQPRTAPRTTLQYLTDFVLQPNSFLRHPHHGRLELLRLLNPNRFQGAPTASKEEKIQMWGYKLLFRVLYRINRNATDASMRDRLPSEMSLQWLFDRPPDGMTAPQAMSESIGAGTVGRVRWAYLMEKEEERALAQVAGTSVGTAIEIE